MHSHNQSTLPEHAGHPSHRSGHSHFVSHGAGLVSHQCLQFFPVSMPVVSVTAAGVALVTGVVGVVAIMAVMFVIRAVVSKGASVAAAVMAVILPAARDTSEY